MKQPDTTHPQAKEPHFLRAWYATPPYATLDKFETKGDHLVVTYSVAGAARPISYRVAL